MSFHGYLIFRCDRNVNTSFCRRGFGSLIEVEKELRTIYINSMCDNFEQVFARITFSSRLSIFTIYSRKDCITLQYTFDYFTIWCNTLNLNINKYNTISFHRTRVTFMYNYILNDLLIECNYQIHDTGILNVPLLVFCP